MRMRYLAFLAIGLLLSGCLAYEETRAQVIPGGTHEQNYSQEIPAQGAPSQNQAAGESLPEPVQPGPEVRVTVERNETEAGAVEKEYFGIEFADYTLILDDLAPRGAEYCALVRIVKVEGMAMHEFDRAQICTGESYYWVSPEQHKYRIKVTETASGYSNGAAWADIIIYS